MIEIIAISAPLQIKAFTFVIPTSLSKILFIKDQREKHKKKKKRMSSTKKKKYQKNLKSKQRNFFIGLASKLQNTDYCLEGPHGSYFMG